MRTTYPFVTLTMQLKTSTSAIKNPYPSQASMNTAPWNSPPLTLASTITTPPQNVHSRMLPPNTTSQKTSTPPLESEMVSHTYIHSLGHNISNLSPIHHFNTPPPSIYCKFFGVLNLHCLFGWHHLLIPKHTLSYSEDGRILNSVELPLTLGAFAKIFRKKQKTTPMHQGFLDVVHMGIVFGGCVSLGGFREELILVNVDTLYSWI